MHRIHHSSDRVEHLLQHVETSSGEEGGRLTHTHTQVRRGGHTAMSVPLPVALFVCVYIRIPYVCRFISCDLHRCLYECECSSVCVCE